MKLVSGLVLLSLAVASQAVAGVGMWTTNGPPGGAAHVVVDPGDPLRLYTETFRSTDGGATWLSNNLTTMAPQAVAVGPSRTVYVGGRDLAGNSTIFRSTDAALTWQPIYSIQNSQFQYAAFGNLDVDPANPDVLYLRGANVGLSEFPFFRRSVDGGRTWTGLAVPNLGEHTGVTSLALDPKTSGILYVSVSGYARIGDGSFKSVDGGATWSPLLTPGNDLIATDPQNPSTVYVANRRAEVPLQKSVDRGMSFVDLGQPGVVYDTLIVSPTDSRRLVTIGVNGAIESTDGGMTFFPIGGALPSATGLVFDPTGTVLHAATDSGVYSDQEDPGVLRLNAAHPFAVTLSAIDPHTGATAPGAASQANDLWGYFAIPAISNNPNNPEVFVKLLDGTAINGDFWFFYGGLTNLEYTLTVTDATTGTQKTYTKPAGSECGGSDTAAFAP